MTFLKQGSKPNDEQAEPRPRTAESHDPDTPPALLEFMVRAWRAPSDKMPRTVDGHTWFKKRRAALSARFPGELLVIPTGHLKVRANDQHYPFRPSSDFYYLTGNLEPDGVLVLVPNGETHTSVLYVEPNPGKTDATFFTDRIKGELWVGARLGVAQSKARFAVDGCRALGELGSDLAAMRRAAQKARITRGVSAHADMAFAAAGPVDDEANAALAQTLSEMRLYKDAFEIRQLEDAISATHRGFTDVARRLKTAKTERELEGVFWLRARTEGNDVGYGTIAACGEHACVLHWNRNDGAVKKGDLLLLDAGVEARTLYTADVTRTLPVSGRFTREQAIVYDLVLEAQRQAFAAVKPGNDFLEPNRVAMRVLTEGLVDLGLLEMSVEEALDPAHQYYRRYTLHNVSHMLGLDVHDCAQARKETYKFGKLVPGMVLTVEPGLYFQPDDLTVPAKFRGIGVRIEDDVLVTSRGARILSDAIPRERKDVEAWMKSAWKK